MKDPEILFLSPQKKLKSWQLCLWKHPGFGWRQHEAATIMVLRCARACRRQPSCRKPHLPKMWMRTKRKAVEQENSGSPFVGFEWIWDLLSLLPWWPTFWSIWSTKLWTKWGPCVHFFKRPRFYVVLCEYNWQCVWFMCDCPSTGYTDIECLI